MLNTLAHRALALAPTLPILTGPAKGLWWDPGSSPVTRYWRGTYERKEVEMFAKSLRPGMTVYDIGAHVGYYSLVAANCGATVVSIEPSPDNAKALRRHVAMNHMTRRVTIIEAAVSDTVGPLAFCAGRSASENHLGPNGNVFVHGTTLDRLVFDERYPPPHAIKIDVEGAELALLAGGEHVLRAHHPTLFLSVHTHVLRAECIGLLRAHGYILGTFSAYPPEATWEIMAR